MLARVSPQIITRSVSEAPEDAESLLTLPVVIEVGDAKLPSGEAIAGALGLRVTRREVLVAAAKGGRPANEESRGPLNFGGRGADWVVVAT